MFDNGLKGPVVLVLASGRGRRFMASGGTVSKLDALLGARTVLQHTLDAVGRSGLGWHLEDRGCEGMGDSIAAAVAATEGASGWLVLPGDLPLVRPESLRAVAASLATHDVVLPTHQGLRGHPVGFGRRCREALLQLTGAAGAASIARAYERGAVALALDDPGIVTDIDTIQDLAAAQRLLAQRPASG